MTTNMAYTADELYAVLKYIQEEQILVFGPWSEPEDQNEPSEEGWIDVSHRQIMGQAGRVWLQRAAEVPFAYRILFDGAGSLGGFSAESVEAAQMLADRQLQSSHGGTEWWRLVDPKNVPQETLEEPVSRAEHLQDRQP
jgi:hypothetical protein